MNPVDGAAESQQQPLSQPRLLPLLRFVPASHERAFRQSVTVRRLSLLLDAGSAFARLTSCSMYLRWNERFSGLGYTSRLLFGLFFLGECIAQLVGLVAAKQLYYKHRMSFLLACRLARLAYLCSDQYYTHITLSTAAATSAPTNATLATGPQTHNPASIMSRHILQSLTPPVQRPAVGTTIKLILLCSGAMAAFMPAVSNPLPFLHQLSLQLLTTFLLLAFQVTSATHLLAHMLPPNGPQRQICHYFNFGAQLLELSLQGSTFHISSVGDVCDAHASRLLVITAILFVGLVLPVYYAYRLEWYMKLLYLQQEFGQHHWPAMSLAVDGVWLAYLAVLAWLMAVLLDQPLARLLGEHL